jgi:hypothetical protein
MVRLLGNQIDHPDGQEEWLAIQSGSLALRALSVRETTFNPGTPAQIPTFSSHRNG